MYITKTNIRALTERLKYALAAPQPMPVIAGYSGHDEDSSNSILNRRLARVRRQSRRQIGSANVRSSWY